MHTFALLATLTSCALSALAGHIPSNAHRHELAKRMPGAISKRDSTHTNARLTYYNTNDGYGACGDQVHDSDYIVALNIAEYGTYWKSSNCNRYVTIQHGGKSVVAQVKDECPGCPYGGLDLTPTVFWALTSVDTPILDATWWYNDDPPSGATTTQKPTTTTQKPTPTSTYTPPTTTSEKPKTTSTPPPPTTTSTTPTPTPTPTTTSTTPTTTSTSSTHSTHSSSASHSSAAQSSDAPASSADPASGSSSAASPSMTAIANAGEVGNLATVYQAILGMGGVAAAGGQVA